MKYSPYARVGIDDRVNLNGEKYHKLYCYKIYPVLSRK